MARQLSREEIQALRRFIVEERRRDPQAQERAIYARFLEAHPALTGHLGWARFRHHFRVVREYAQRQWQALHELQPDEVDRIGEASGADRRGRRAQFVRRLDGLQQRLDAAQERQQAAEKVVIAAEREIQELTQALRQTLRAYEAEISGLSTAPTVQPPSEASQA